MVRRLSVVALTVFVIALVAWRPAHTTSAVNQADVREDHLLGSAVTLDSENGWGFHAPKVARTADGSVWLGLIFDAPDTNARYGAYTYQHHNWAIAHRAPDGTWSTPYRATTEDEQEPPLLQVSGSHVLAFVAPAGVLSMWDSTTNAVTPLSGGWAVNTWQYLAASTTATGDTYVLQSVAGTNPNAQNTPGVYNWSVRSADGTWSTLHTFQTEVRFAYMYLFPNTPSAGTLTAVGTRDALWQEVGYTPPPNVFPYAFNQIGLFEVTESTVTKHVLREEAPTAQYPAPYLLAADVFQDRSNRLHVIWAGYGASTNNNYTGGHLLVENSTVTGESALPIPFQNYGRLLEDPDGHLVAVSMYQDTMYVTTANDERGTTFSPADTIHLASTNVGALTSQPYLAAPRNGSVLTTTATIYANENTSPTVFDISLSTNTPPATTTPTAIATSTVTATAIATNTPTPTAIATATPTPTATATATSTATATATPARTYEQGYQDGFNAGFLAGRRSLWQEIQALLGTVQP